MFLLIPNDRPSHWKAVISTDNLTIEWPKGPDETMTEPPWNDLYMPRYDAEFRAARRSYNLSEVNFRKLPVPNPETLF